MKKLLILASLLGASFSVNAASFTWGFTGYDYVNAKGEGADASSGYNLWSGGTAYLYLGTVTATSSAFDFSNAKFITSATYNSETLVYGNADAYSLSKSDDVPSTDKGQNYSLILVDADKELSSYEGNYVLYTGSSERGVIPGATVTYYADFTNANPVAQGDWKSMSVPEPTSAMLLMLGLCGLALKRKQA